MKDRLLTVKDLLEYHKQIYPYMYRGNDDAWCEVQVGNITSAFSDFYVRLNREAQDAKTLRLVIEELARRIGVVEREIKFKWRNNQEYRDGVQEGVEQCRKAMIKIVREFGEEQ